MAFINDIYVQVIDEEIQRKADVSDHSVEKGAKPIDHININGEVLSISGIIASYTINNIETTAAAVISKIETLYVKGTVIAYNGRNYGGSYIITSFNTAHPNTVHGGAKFDMELREFIWVENSYVETPVKNSSVKNGGQQQVEKGENEEVWYTVKKGDCVAALVAEPNAPYKNLKRDGAASGYWGACNWVMAKNPKAFSRAGDFKTLQIGKKILLGMR